MGLAENPDILACKGDSSLPRTILDLSTPYAFFKYVFNDDIQEHILEQTLLYSTQKDPANPFKA